MASKSKENLSEADAAYKEELDSLVVELLNLDLSTLESENLLLKLVDHATNDFGNISTIPKALQFLVSHKVALDEYYKRYTLKNGEDTYSLVLLLELVSFLEAINLTDSPKKDKNQNVTEHVEESEKVEAPKFKLLLYKLEANLVAARLLSSSNDPVTNSTGSNVANQLVLNGLSKETVEFLDQTHVKYKPSEKTKKLLLSRKVSDWGNEYLISLSSQLVAYYSLPSTRQEYADYVDNLNKDPNKSEKDRYNRKLSVVLENNVNLIISESLKLIEEMTTYWLANGFEFDAIDLLLEVDKIESIEDKCSDDYDLVTRVSSYLASISSYGATYSETCRILVVTYNLLLKNKRYVEATRVALKLNDYHRVSEVLRTCKDLNVLKQVSLMLSTNHLYLNTLSVLCSSTPGVSGTNSLSEHFNSLNSFGNDHNRSRSMSLDSTNSNDNTNMDNYKDNYSYDSSRMNEDVPEFDETVLYLNSGENRSSLFLSMCKELEVLEPKHPYDVFKGYPFKSNLPIATTLSGVSIDSARDNLSYSFVNAFVNCGTSTEKLINPNSNKSSSSNTDSSTGGNNTDNTNNSSNTKEKKDDWLFKHQGYGLMCASASLGLVHLWNLDEGLSEIDKYQYSSDQYIRSGAYVAFGLVSCGVFSELDPILGLLTDKLDSENSLERLGAILGLAFSYSGTNRVDLLEMLIPLTVDMSSLECSIFSSLALSIIFVGTGNQESSEAILQVLMEYISNSDFSNDNENEKGDKVDAVNLKHLRIYILSLGLLQLCRGDLCEPVLEALKVLGPYEKLATTVVESFAHATSGDVLKIQNLLKNMVPHLSFNDTERSERPSKKDKEDNMDMDLDPVTNNMNSSNNNTSNTNNNNNTQNNTNNNNNRNSSTSSNKTNEKKSQTTDKDNKNKNDDKDKEKKLDKEVEDLLGLSVLCISVISLGERIGSSMLIRLLEHPLQCGTPHERRAVPLAIALVNVSNPAPQIVSVLSKLSHDPDREVALHAVLGLGIVGAGTNNSRVSQILQGIAKHSNRDLLTMFVLRVSAGLLFMGKGTLTLSPLHSDSFLLNKVSLAGLLVVLFCSLDLRIFVCEEYPFLFLFLGLSIRPRWLVTLNTDLEVVNIPVRVGTSVDTIGTAGKQRKVSGFQTHKTPVLIGVGERAELATEEVESLSPYLEGIVLVSNVEHKL